MSELSEIYSQFENSLIEARDEYEESLRKWSDQLVEDYDAYLENHLHSFGRDFSDQLGKMDVRQDANTFFGQEEIPFVAIDGSCDKIDHGDFLSFYGGAYGAKGTISFEADSANLEYDRWELARDVSMVAFLPMPPDQLISSVEGGSGSDQRFTDAEVRNLSSIHSRVMQLAEIYLAYSQTQSGVEYPRLIMLDLSLSGLLGNTSHSPDDVELTKGTFEGETLEGFDLRVGSAHPFNEELSVPTLKENQAWKALIRGAHERGDRVIERSESVLSDDMFVRAAKSMERHVDIVDSWGPERIELKDDPRASWRRCRNVFETVCRRLFREKDLTTLQYRGQEGGRRFMKPEDINFLTGIGLRALIERCWEQQIMLVGVAKDSSSRYFHRNFLGSAAIDGCIDGSQYREAPLSDRKIIELLSHLLPEEEAVAPWGTIEFDSAFLTLHPEEDESTGETAVQGYMMHGIGRVTRPERLFLRSIPIFLINREGGLTSHAIFVDRLAYPGWDDADSGDWTIDVPRMGPLNPLYYDTKTGPPRLQHMSTYLLSILVKNLFPEALGYPDPLRQADWGAKTMKRRVSKLMRDGDVAMRSNPLERSMREIRSDLSR